MVSHTHVAGATLATVNYETLYHGARNEITTVINNVDAWLKVNNAHSAAGIELLRVRNALKAWLTANPT